jgi:hypothetical protein
VWFAAGGRKGMGEGRKTGTKDERKRERESKEREKHTNTFVFCQKYPDKSKKVLSKVKKNHQNRCLYLYIYIRMYVYKCIYTHLLEAVIHRYM